MTTVGIASCKCIFGMRESMLLRCSADEVADVDTQAIPTQTTAAGQAVFMDVLEEPDAETRCLLLGSSVLFAVSHALHL